MACADRKPGRRWEVIDAELQKLAVFPSAWPLPFTLPVVKEAIDREASQTGRAALATGAGGGPGQGTQQQLQAEAAQYEIKYLRVVKKYLEAAARERAHNPTSPMDGEQFPLQKAKTTPFNSSAEGVPNYREHCTVLPIKQVRPPIQAHK